MSKLHPVPKAYIPGYPATLSESEIEELLRPSLWQRYGRKAMAVGAAIVVGGLSSCSNPAQEPLVNVPGELPRYGNSTRTDPKLHARTQRIADEVLGTKIGSWNRSTRLEHENVISSNPPIKVPHIAISFGNSYVGILDTERAKESTRRLFAEWGLQLQPNIRVKGNGYEFEADGFDANAGIGFKLIVPEGQVGFGSQKLPLQTDAQKLDTEELKALDRDIADGKIKMLVVPATSYPNMDGDLYTPMQFYLATVIDYLNWVHGDTEIDKDAILGSKWVNPKGR